ncbi:hypothetical protein J3R82DRAFT_6155 [Butyriboletus roseoflavus]|nr:hypothetical protein J3R82DRAFT_6155 [Butyriboletus roseoflavus]
MTDEDRSVLEQSSRPQEDLKFDPDGAPLPSDPGSPDKTSAELMLLPERFLGDLAFIYLAAILYANLFFCMYLYHRLASAKLPNPPQVPPRHLM